MTETSAIPDAPRGRQGQPVTYRNPVITHPITSVLCGLLVTAAVCGGWPGAVYIGFTAFLINAVTAVVLTLILKAAKVPEGADETLPHRYTADPEKAPAPIPAGVGLGPAAGDMGGA